MSELRHDTIQKRWVIIAAERGKRSTDFDRPKTIVSREAQCPFCPGNEALTPPEITALRPGGGPPDSPGWTVRVIPNRFPALGVETRDLARSAEGIYDRMNGVGAHEVIIEGPEHDGMMADYSVEKLTEVFKIYRSRLTELMRDPRLRYVLIFKNHGEAAGASLAHPHSQVIAMPVTPRTVAIELRSAREHYILKERCLICDIIRQERVSGSRMVYDDAGFVAFAPYASRFPFELFVAPRSHSSNFGAATDGDLENLGRCMKEIMTRLKRALHDPPFNFVIHTSPNANASPVRPGYWMTLDYDYHWHLEIIPRLTKLAGFEWGTGFYINPTSPESAAEYLRKVPVNGDRS